MNEPFTTSHKIVPAITVTEGAAGAIDLEGAALDLDGFDHVCMVVIFGAIVSGAACYIKAQESVDAAFSSPLDITGTKQVIADTQGDKVFYIDILRPDKQYVRLHVDIATQNVTCTAFYVLYGPRNKPVTQPAAVTGERFKDPITGTA